MKTNLSVSSGSNSAVWIVLRSKEQSLHKSARAGLLRRRQWYLKGLPVKTKERCSSRTGEYDDCSTSICNFSTDYRLIISHMQTNTAYALALPWHSSQNLLKPEICEERTCRWLVWSITKLSLQLCIAFLHCLYTELQICSCPTLALSRSLEKRCQILIGYAANLVNKASHEIPLLAVRLCIYLHRYGRLLIKSPAAR